MDPLSDPSSFPGQLYAGPYGFVAAIAFFLFLAARELRRYRQIDVDTYQTEITTLKTDLVGLRDEVRQLRHDAIEDARTAHAQIEVLTRENAGYRLQLATNGLTPVVV